jgi:hypothetical protein
MRTMLEPLLRSSHLQSIQLAHVTIRLVEYYTQNGQQCMMTKMNAEITQTYTARFYFHDGFFGRNNVTKNTAQDKYKKIAAN